MLSYVVNLLTLFSHCDHMLIMHLYCMHGFQLNCTNELDYKLIKEGLIVKTSIT